MSFFIDWFYELSPVDTVRLLLLVTFTVFSAVYVGRLNKKTVRKRRKSNKQKEEDGNKGPSTKEVESDKLDEPSKPDQPKES